MTFEVELKFPLNDPMALPKLQSRMENFGAVAEGTVDHLDCYFNHPSRDFAVTDEALRTRTIGDQTYVTYKGPLVDTVTKTRRELELPVGIQAKDGQNFTEILGLLGFRKVREVRKTRSTYAVSHENRAFEIAVDNVETLGTFVEVETTASAEDRDEAIAALLQITQQLGLENSQRRSYLSMLLEADEKSQP
jgi:adenylate cyclase, class 2